MTFLHTPNIESIFFIIYKLWCELWFVTHFSKVDFSSCYAPYQQKTICEKCPKKSYDWSVCVKMQVFTKGKYFDF